MLSPAQPCRDRDTSVHTPSQPKPAFVSTSQKITRAPKPGYRGDSPFQLNPSRGSPQFEQHCSPLFVVSLPFPFHTIHNGTLLLSLQQAQAQRVGSPSTTTTTTSTPTNRAPTLLARRVRRRRRRINRPRQCRHRPPQEDIQHQRHRTRDRAALQARPQELQCQCNRNPQRHSHPQRGSWRAVRDDRCQ